LFQASPTSVLGLHPWLFHTKTLNYWSKIACELDAFCSLFQFHLVMLLSRHSRSEHSFFAAKSNKKKEELFLETTECLCSLTQTQLILHYHLTIWRFRPIVLWEKSVGKLFVQWASLLHNSYNWIVITIMWRSVKIRLLTKDPYFIYNSNSSHRNVITLW